MSIATNTSDLSVNPCGSPGTGCSSAPRLQLVLSCQRQYSFSSVSRTERRNLYMTEPKGVFTISSSVMVWSTRRPQHLLEVRLTQHFGVEEAPLLPRPTQREATRRWQGWPHRGERTLSSRKGCTYTWISVSRFFKYPRSVARISSMTGCGMHTNHPSAGCMGRIGQL